MPVPAASITLVASMAMAIGRQDRAAGGDRAIDRAVAVDEAPVAAVMRPVLPILPLTVGIMPTEPSTRMPTPAAEIVPALAMPPVRVDALTSMAVGW